MKCPMQILKPKVRADVSRTVLETLDFFECIQGKCGQYDKEREQCIEVTKGQALEKIAHALGRYKG